MLYFRLSACFDRETGHFPGKIWWIYLPEIVTLVQIVILIRKNSNNGNIWL